MASTTSFRISESLTTHSRSLLSLGLGGENLFKKTLKFVIGPDPRCMYTALTVKRLSSNAKSDYCKVALHVKTKKKGCSGAARSEEHTSELQSLRHLVCR